MARCAARRNPLRVESPAEAAVIDRRIAEAWAGHPNILVIDCEPDFLVKARRALDVLAAQLPACCRPIPVASPDAARMSHPLLLQNPGGTP